MKPELEKMLKDAYEVIDDLPADQAASIAQVAILTMILEELREIKELLAAKK